MEFANYIRELVVDKKYDVEISTENKLSNIEEVRKELLKLAIEDSKEKAGYVAELMGQKIGKERGYAVILNTDSNACPYIDTTIADDITTIVKDALR